MNPPGSRVLSGPEGLDFVGGRDEGAHGYVPAQFGTFDAILRA